MVIASAGEDGLWNPMYSSSIVTLVRNHTFWNIWKERNRKIFDNLIETVPQVAARIKEDIQQRKRALEYV